MAAFPCRFTFCDRLIMTVKELEKSSRIMPPLSLA